MSTALGIDVGGSGIKRTLVDLTAGELHTDPIVIGGGISKEHAESLDLLEARARIVPAALRTHAGTIGATLAWKEAT